jgi:hypothetical protein
MARNNALEEVKIALQWYDTRVNGSLSALIGVAFGVFGILRLYDKIPVGKLLIWQLPSNWILLTISYILIGFLGLYFFLRMVGYSTMANRGGERLLPNSGTARVAKELKTNVRNATNLDWYQKWGVNVIGTRWIAVGLIVAIYFISWVGAAIQF